MSSTPSPRASLLLASRLLFGCLPLALPAIACAQQQVQAFDIAPGTLGEVLGRYAQAAGTPIVFQSQQVAGLNSAGLRGSYSVAEGFAKVLEGTGFTAQASAVSA